MTYEEKLERALRMRSRDLFGQVSPEELAGLPAVQTELQIPMANGETVHLYELRPKSDLPSSCPLVINYHGGGFIKGRQDKDQVFCSNLAANLNLLVWDVDYRLAPEYPFPTAMEESFAVAEYAYTHAEELGIDSHRIVLAGHSAGGNLAITVCMRAGETGIFHPAALVAEYCPLDLATDPAEKPRAPGDMPAEVSKTYNAFYCDPETARIPYVSPLFAEDAQLRAFPDTLILSAKNDSLSFEDAEFAAKLALAGVTVTAKRFQNSRHGFTINRDGDWEPAERMITRFIREHIE